MELCIALAYDKPPNPELDKWKRMDGKKEEINCAVFFVVDVSCTLKPLHDHQTEGLCA